MTAFHLDAGFQPLFPFGYGLSYTQFEYRDMDVSARNIALGDTITISATLQNTGNKAATEVVQLYIRDLVGNVTRPVRELKGFKRVALEPGQHEKIDFTLHTDELAFYNRKMELVTEPGGFHAWIGGSSEADLWAEFEILDSQSRVDNA